MSSFEKTVPAENLRKLYSLNDDDQIRKGLAQLYEDRSMCDVELEADGKIFAAHKIVLAAGITYFEAMFTRGFKEADGKCIALEGVSSTGLEMVLHALYKGEIELTDGTFQDAVAASHHLQYQPLLDVCQKYLMDTLDTKNCVDFRRIADVYMTSVVCVIDRYILDNFKLFSQCNSSFQQVTKDELCRYLKDDSLIAEEIEIFEAIKRWISHDDERKKFSSEAAKFLRHGLIEDKFKCEVADVLPSLKDAIEQSKNSDGENNQNSQREMMSPIIHRNHFVYRPRGYKTYAMLLRGRSHPYRYSNDGEKDKVGFLREKDVDGRTEFVGWRALPPVPFLDLSVHSFVFNNFWFLLGVDSDGYSYAFLSYDVKSQKWLMMESPSTFPSIGTYSFLLGDKICIGGGQHVSEALDSKSEKPSINNQMCVYDIANEEWREIEENLAEFSTNLVPSEKKVPSPFVVYAAHCSFNGDGFVIGGYKNRSDENSDEEIDSPWDEYVTCKSVAVFKQDRDCFVEKAALRSPRCHATAGVVGKYILVVGGLPSESRRPEHACEIYSPLSDQWTYVHGDQTIGDALFVPTPTGFAIQKDENYPLLYFEADEEGNVKTYDKMYMPGMSWNPGRDHWRDIGCKIMTVAVLTMLPMTPGKPGTWVYKTKDTVFGLFHKAEVEPSRSNSSISF